MLFQIKGEAGCAYLLSNIELCANKHRFCTELVIQCRQQGIVALDNEPAYTHVISQWGISMMGKFATVADVR